MRLVMHVTLVVHRRSGEPARAPRARARARDNLFVRGLFQATQVSIPIKLSTPDPSRMVWMLANTKLKPNGPLICGLQRFSAPKPSNRADRFASNRISAHGSDSMVVGDWFVVSWDRVPNHFDSESVSPPIDCWFDGSRQQLLKSESQLEAKFRCNLSVGVIFSNYQLVTMD